MPMLLTYDDAVIITRQLIDYFNSPDSDNTILFLADRFNLRVKDDFTVRVNAILKDCPECSGCEGGQCILGCYETYTRDKPGVLCFTSTGLEKRLGTKLIVHEMGHVIYDQIFESGLPPDQDYNQSENFALYMENNFDLNMDYLIMHGSTSPQIHPRLQRIGEAIIIGVAISAASILIANYVYKRKSKNALD